MTIMRHIAADDTVIELVVSRSRFIAAVSIAADDEAARAYIAARRKHHPKAGHHCVAYIVGPGGTITRSNDDGEPSGTAGAPMLETLRHHGLCDTVAVVSRFFGGIKLGTGGLARAYAQAVSEAIAASGTVGIIAATMLTIHIDYAGGGSLEADLRAGGISVHDIRYDNSIHIDVSIPDARLREFTAWLAGHTAGAATWEVTGTGTMEDL